MTAALAYEGSGRVALQRVVEVGSASGRVEFDMPVGILLEGQAGAARSTSRAARTAGSRRSTMPARPTMRPGSTTTWPAPALRRLGAFAAPPSPARRGPLPQAALQMQGGAPRRSTRLRRHSRRRRRRIGRTGCRAPGPRAGHALRGTGAHCLRLSPAISVPSCRTRHFCALSCRRLFYTRHDQPRTLSCRKTRLCGQSACLLDSAQAWRHGGGSWRKTSSSVSTILRRRPSILLDALPYSLWHALVMWTAYSLHSPASIPPTALP